MALPALNRSNTNELNVIGIRQSSYSKDFQWSSGSR